MTYLTLKTRLRQMNKKNCLHTEGQKHNCVYVDEINKYVDRAADAANKKCGKGPKVGDDKTEWANNWDKTYFAEIRKLTRYIRCDFSEWGKVN